MGILFLTIDEILEIHKDQIERYGGKSAIRDLELLESAIGILDCTRIIRKKLRTRINFHFKSLHGIIQLR
ncbi:MAG: hypothetical protein ACYC0V_20255 [Armatimonadota bacterium]